MRPARCAIAVVALVLLVLPACGGGDEPPAAQPSPDQTTFEQGDFDDLPLPGRAEPAGDRSESDGVVVRSYVIRNKRPEDVLQFYAQALAEDTVVTAPRQSGNTAWRGEWRLADGRELLVTAIPAPTATGEQYGEAVDVVTQFSLTLRPAA